MRQAKKAGRIRQGSPEEEVALGEHLLALAPALGTLTEVCRGVGGLECLLAGHLSEFCVGGW
jgi:hypothetical protein